MVEAMGKIGGSSRLSSGVVMGAGTRYQRSKGITDDSPEKFLRHYMDVNNWRIQPTIAHRLCYGAAPTVDWLEESGVVYQSLMSSGNEERPRGHVTGGGDKILAVLNPLLQKYGDKVDVALRTRVTRLAMNEGGVMGIYAGDDCVTAKAVVVTVGGLGADMEMVRRWQPEILSEGAQVPYFLGGAGSRGDAIRFADQIDAQIVKGYGLLAPIYPFGGGYLPRFVLAVNGLGHRFMNEAWGYGAAQVQVANQPGCSGFCIFDDNTKQAMRTRADVLNEMSVIPPDENMAGGFTSSSVDDYVAQGLITKADTLEQLAQRLSLPLQAFLGTVTRYNRMCTNGFDEDYLKKTTLRPVAKGPFYAFTLKLAGFALTTTGLRIDHNASVIHRNSDPIPGLFAAGECTGSVVGKVYVGSGNCLASCSTFGRLAGRHAAAYALDGAIPPTDWASIGLTGPVGQAQAAQ
jgi:fumarate reductase flavoprotein subunit